MEKELKKVGGLWEAQQGADDISGELLEIQEDVGEYHSRVYVLETKDEIRTVYGSTVLDDKMRFAKVGDFVKIVFLGLKKGEKKDYKNYDVYMARKKQVVTP